MRSLLPSPLTETVTSDICAPHLGERGDAIATGVLGLGADIVRLPARGTIVADKTALSVGSIQSNINTYGSTALCTANNPPKRQTVAAQMLRRGTTRLQLPSLVIRRQRGGVCGCDAGGSRDRRRHHEGQNTMRSSVTTCGNNQAALLA
jgi:hypothetical protein